VVFDFLSIPGHILQYVNFGLIADDQDKNTMLKEWYEHVYPMHMHGVFVTA